MSLNSFEHMIGIYVIFGCIWSMYCLYLMEKLPNSFLSPKAAWVVSGLNMILWPASVLNAFVYGWQFIGMKSAITAAYLESRISLIDVFDESVERLELDYVRTVRLQRVRDKLLKIKDHAGLDQIIYVFMVVDRIAQEAEHELAPDLAALISLIRSSLSSSKTSSQS